MKGYNDINISVNMERIDNFAVAPTPLTPELTVYSMFSFDGSTETQSFSAFLSSHRFFKLFFPQYLSGLAQTTH